MTHQFVIAPDFSPEHFAGWHMFNAFLQKHTNLNVHLQTPSSHDEQLDIINNDMPAIIYANPFDAAYLIREKGYKAFAKPIDKPDEMLIVSSSRSDIESIEDLKSGCKIAMPDNRDVKLIGLRLLEVADLTEDDIHFDITENYQAAARQVITEKADAAFFLQETFESMSKLTKSQMKVLIESDISIISHVFLVKDGFENAQNVAEVVLSLNEDDNGQSILTELGIAKGFASMTEEEAEFMLDLMETLLD